MIYLFDRCYLSTTNTIVENAKQVWVGNHPDHVDTHAKYSFDIYKMFETINTLQLDELFEEIHLNMKNDKIVIYADNEYFTYIYYFFFRGFLPKEAVDEMFKYDLDKENFGLGDSLYGLYVTGSKAIKRVQLTEGTNKPTRFSQFSSTVVEPRIEIAFANALLGNKAAMQYCVERATLMWDGTPGFRAKYAEQTLPALLNDEQYTIANISSETFVNNFIGSFQVDEFLPVKVLDKVEEVFKFDYLNHYFNVVNENNFTKEQILDLWLPASKMTKSEFIEKYLLNPNIPARLELLFPSISDFDSLNPIFWNAVFRHHNDTSWLSKYGINNQTYGTV